MGILLALAGFILISDKMKKLRGFCLLLIKTMIDAFPTLPEINTFYGIDLMPCDRTSCRLRCVQPEPEVRGKVLSNCMCDEYCVVFGDCCWDYYTLCHAFLAEDHMLNFMKDLGKLKDRKDTIHQIQRFRDLASCSVFFESRFTSSLFFTISTCPDDFKDYDNTREKCEKEDSAFPFDIPVSIQRLPFWTFKNAYCAKCHGFQVEEVMFWNAEISCYVRNGIVLRTVDEFINEEEKVCRTVIKPPEWALVRACNKKNEQPCNESQIDPLESTAFSLNTTDSSSALGTTLPSSTLNTPDNMNQTRVEILTPTRGTEAAGRENLVLLCNSYYFGYGMGPKSYYNPHCYACSELKGNQSFKEIPPGCGFIHPEIWAQMIPNAREVSYRLKRYQNQLFIYSMELLELLADGRSSCTQWEYYDSLTFSCKLKVCPEGFSPYFDSCLNKSLAPMFKPEINLPDIYMVTISMNIEMFVPEPMTFLEIVRYLDHQFQTSPFGQITVGPSTQSHSRKIDIESVILKRKSSKTLSGTKVTFEPKLISVKMNVYLPFGDFHTMLTSFHTTIRSQYGLSDFTVLDFEIRPPNSEVECPINKGLKRFTNISDMIYYGHHALTTDGISTFDVSKTDFVIKGNRSSGLKLVNIAVCMHNDQIKTIQAIDTPVRPNPSQTCRTVIITDKHFRIVKNGIQLKNGKTERGMAVMQDGQAFDCVDASLSQSVISTPDIWFKNIISSIALALKVISFFAIVLMRKSNYRELYLQSLTLMICSIDIVHLLENLDFENSQKTISIMLHFSWLLVIYSMLAWVINMTCVVSCRTLKIVGRHIAISFTVPALVIIICATGDENDPPWEVEYGERGKLIDTNRYILMYGFMIPCAVALLAIIVCYFWRCLRSHSKTNSIIFVYHALITALLVVQIGFALGESLADIDVLFYMYLAMSLLIGWTFLLLGLRSASRKVSLRSNGSGQIYKTDPNGPTL